MGIMQLLNIILLWVFLGFLASYIAKRRGRNPFVWFFAGLLLSIWGVILVLALPNRKRPFKPVASPPLRRPQRNELWLKMWYYMDPTHQQKGPIELPDLAKLHKEKKLSETSFIWGEGMKDWKRLAELPDLLQEMDQA